MPTKFVQHSAEKAGISVEAAEEKWHEAKKAVKKGKRRGHWYWGKVVNTFKKMMGFNEGMTFKEFALLESEEELQEVKIPTAPAIDKLLPEIIMLDSGFYLDKLPKKGLKIRYNLLRLMDDGDILGQLFIVKRGDYRGSKLIVQLHHKDWGPVGTEMLDMDKLPSDLAGTIKKIVQQHMYDPKMKLPEAQKVPNGTIST